MTAEQEIDDLVDKWFAESLARIFQNFPIGWVLVQTGENITKS